jgi:hypothetical protein
MFASIVRKIRDAASAFGEAAQGKLGATNAVMWQHNMMKLADELDKPAFKRDYPHIPSDTEHEVYDWSKASIGMIVTRSEHWRGQNKGRKNQSMYGILTDLSFFQDSKGRLVTWPSIHWENESFGNMNHPLNVKPLRKSDRDSLPKIKMDDGQWGTEGKPS